MLVRLSMRLQCRAICVNERFISVGRGVNGRRGILAARNLIPLAAARWLREPQAHIALYLLPGANVAVMRHCQTATTTDSQPEDCRRMLSAVSVIICAKGKFEMPLTHTVPFMRPALELATITFHTHLIFRLPLPASSKFLPTHILTLTPLTYLREINHP